MIFTMPKATWDGLSPWKKRALRYVMGELLLGDPATATDTDGTETVVFSDDRFSAEGAYALRLVLAGIDALPDEPAANDTPEGVLAAAGADAKGAQAVSQWAVGVDYAVDDKVLYNGELWKCVQAHTSQSDWAPGVAQALWSHPGPSQGGGSGGAGPTAWAAQTAYAVGDQVTYQGTTYSCLQAHTSQVGWEPPNVPALWQPV